MPAVMSHVVCSAVIYRILKDGTTACIKVGFGERSDGHIVRFTLSWWPKCYYYFYFTEPVQDQRFERLEDELLKDPTHVEKLKYKENVLGKNIPPSLQKN